MGQLLVLIHLYSNYHRLGLTFGRVKAAMAQSAPAISALWTTVQRGWGPHWLWQGIDRNLTNRNGEITRNHQNSSEGFRRYKNKYQKTCLLYTCVIYAHGNKSPETINSLGHLRIAAEIPCPKMRAEVSNRRPTNCWKRCRWLGKWKRSLYFVKPHSWWLNMVKTC